MRHNILRVAAAMALTSLVLALAGGCQTPGFLAGNGPKRATPADEVQPLSNGQVADVQFSMARSVEQRGDVDAALNAYRQALEKDPKRSIGYWRMAVLNDRKGNVQESEKLYRQALKLDPKNPEIRCDFGYSLYLQRRWAEAEDNLHEALAVKPAHARSHTNLGLVLAQTDRPDEALAEFRKSGREEAEARANLAFVLTMNRHWDEACQQYELALDANPGSAAAKSGLENLEALLASAARNPSPVSPAHYERPADSRTAEITPAVLSSRPGYAAVAPARAAD